MSFRYDKSFSIGNATLAISVLYCNWQQMMARKLSNLYVIEIIDSVWMTVFQSESFSHSKSLIMHNEELGTLKLAHAKLI